MKETEKPELTQDAWDELVESKKREMAVIREKVREMAKAGKQKRVYYIDDERHEVWI
uniref:Uncharacterized protein n=1 Tax=Arion vulgaris TaxID=1028688 RepID=A0A0B7BUR5_9EUPU